MNPSPLLVPSQRRVLPRKTRKALSTILVWVWMFCLLLQDLRPGHLLHVRLSCTERPWPWKVLPSSTRADCRSIVQCNNPYRRGTILNLPCVSSVTVAWKKHTSRLQNPWPMNCFNWIRDKAPERGQIHRTEVSRFPACLSRIRSNSTE